jgi:hypothetical protein
VILFADRGGRHLLSSYLSSFELSVEVQVVGSKNHISAEIAFALYLTYFRKNRWNGGNLANTPFDS